MGEYYAELIQKVIYYSLTNIKNAIFLTSHYSPDICVFANKKSISDDDVQL